MGINNMRLSNMSKTNAQAVALVEGLSSVSTYINGTFAVLELVKGRENGFIAFSPLGKVIIVNNAAKAGWAAVGIHEEREKCYLGGVVNTVWLKTESSYSDGLPIHIEGYESPEALQEAVVKAAADHKANREHQALKRAFEVAKAHADYEEKLDQCDTLAGPEGVALGKALSKMDWYYSYSDDSSVWRAGQAKMEALCADRDALQEAGREIWSLYAPTGF